MGKSALLLLGVVVTVLLACGTEWSIGLPLGKREDNDTTIPENATSENVTATLNITDGDNTDILKELSDADETLPSDEDSENVEHPFVGPMELMNMMSNLVDDHDGHDLMPDNNIDDDGQGNVIILSSEENDDEAFPYLNFLPLMENPVEAQNPGILKEFPMIEEIPVLDIPEIPIIKEVVISGPNQNNVLQHMSDLMKPTSIQQQMVNMMEEVTQFADRIFQGMKNRMGPLRYEGRITSAVHDPQESNRNLPFRVVPFEWQETTKDNGIDNEAETDDASHGIAKQQVDNPTTEEADEAQSGTVKDKDVEEIKHELKPEEKPEGKVLIRTERVTEEEEPKRSGALAHQPILNVIQQVGGSAKKGKPEV